MAQDRFVRPLNLLVHAENQNFLLLGAAGSGTEAVLFRLHELITSRSPKLTSAIKTDTSSKYYNFQGTLKEIVSFIVPASNLEFLFPLELDLVSRKAFVAEH